MFSKQALVGIILFIYVFILGSVFFLSLNLKNNDKRFQTVYFLASTLLGLFGLLTMGLLVQNVIDVFNTNVFDCNSKQGFKSTYLLIQYSTSQFMVVVYPQSSE